MVLVRFGLWAGWEECNELLGVKIGPAMCLDGLASVLVVRENIWSKISQDHTMQWFDLMCWMD